MMRLLKNLYWSIDDHVSHLLWKYGEDLFWIFVLLAFMYIVAGGPRPW